MREVLWCKNGRFSPQEAANRGALLKNLSGRNPFSTFSMARVAFKGGGEMSCYQLCMTTLVGCPCV